MARGLAALVGFFAAVVGAGAGSLGCGGESRVARVVDGRVLVGSFVEPEAYADFLRGAIAEERGEPQIAMLAYREAASRGADDPEIWTRIGAIQCRAHPNDPAISVSFDRALAMDPVYGPAWDAKAQCALARGELPVAVEDARRAAFADPRAVAPQVLLAEAAGVDGQVAEARRRLVALALQSGSIAAWDALAAWGRGHGDALLVARALSEIAARAPSRRAEAGARAVALAGDGELGAARELASALVDAPGDRSSGGLGPAPSSAPLVARLAIDAALLAGDERRALARAVRAHVGRDVVAGRALLFGDAALAWRIAEPVLASDPSASGSRMVLAAAGAELGSAIKVDESLAAAGRATTPIPQDVLLPFARLLARAGTQESARSFVEQIPHERLAGGDAVLTRIAVELAAAGVLKDDELPADARIELAARRLELPPESMALAADARHQLFAFALCRPQDPAVLALAKTLAPGAARDALIAVALVRLALARGTAVDQELLDRLVALAPADPLVASAVLDAAKKRGDEGAIAPARARLTALARTPGERAHALE